MPIDAFVSTIIVDLSFSLFSSLMNQYCLLVVLCFLGFLLSKCFSASLPGGGTGYSAYGTGSSGGYGSGYGGINITPTLTADGCFRVMRNCVIAQAQPFERKTLFTLTECQQRCLATTTTPVGTFSCKSFVYDNINQVCDLFGHTGTTLPARLVGYSGRDYYEPTGTCTGIGGSTAGPLPADVVCSAGFEAKFLTIQGFELQGADDTILPGLSETQCVEVCTNNQLSNGTQVACRSFDYLDRVQECRISLEAVIPAGSGRLTPNPTASYNEKICLPSSSVTGCPDQFERFPQKLLVGFAERVITADSLEACLEQCLNSRVNFGVACRSGMFFFEETQNNCILNSVDKNSNPDLFTDELEDPVDYFEPGCNRRLTGKQVQRLRKPPLKPFYTTDVTKQQEQFVGQLRLQQDIPDQANYPNEDLRLSFDLFEAGSHEHSRSNTSYNFVAWTAWTPCTVAGSRIRYQRCSAEDLRKCPAETQHCTGSARPSSINSKLIRYDPSLTTLQPTTPARRLISEGCSVGQCCRYRDSCRVGILTSSEGKTDFCINPCGRG